MMSSRSLLCRQRVVHSIGGSGLRRAPADRSLGGRPHRRSQAAWAGPLPPDVHARCSSASNTPPDGRVNEENMFFFGSCACHSTKRHCSTLQVKKVRIRLVRRDHGQSNKSHFRPDGRAPWAVPASDTGHVTSARRSWRTLPARSVWEHHTRSSRPGLRLVRRLLPGPGAAAGGSG